MAGEINLPYYLDKGFPRGGEKQTADWEEVIRYVRKINAFGRPVTVHPTGLPPLSGRALYKDQELARLRHAPDRPRRQGGAGAVDPHIADLL